MNVVDELTQLKEEEKQSEREQNRLCGLPCFPQTNVQWGFLLMVAGSIWLLGNLGFLATVAGIWLWPLLLICCGLFMLAVFRR